MGRNSLNRFEYEYLTGTWEGPRGAAYNATAEFCQELGYGNPDKLTQKGLSGIKAYQANENYKRIDVI